LCRYCVSVVSRRSCSPSWLSTGQLLSSVFAVTSDPSLPSVCTGQLNLPTRLASSTAVGTPACRWSPHYYRRVHRTLTSSPIRPSLDCRPVADGHQLYRARRHQPVGPTQPSDQSESPSVPGKYINPAVARQRRRRYARRSTANRSPTDIRRARADPASPVQLSLPTVLGPRLRLPSRITTAYQPCQLKVRPSADRRRRLTPVRHLRSTPIQSVVPFNRKPRLSTMASWASRHLLANRAAGHTGRRAIKGMPVPSSNRPSPVVPPRSTPYPPDRKWSAVEPEVGVQLDPGRGEVVVFLPRNSLQQLLPVLRSRCLPP